MKIICDTNVFVSGVFFTGPPFEILQAWRAGNVQRVISPEIVEEYQRVGERLAADFPGVSLDPVLDLLVAAAIVVEAPPLPRRVCVDPDDDKFLACAVASKTRIIVSGDKHLLRMSGYRGIAVLRAREFVDKYIKRKAGAPRS